jgi:hypothetical protein
MPAKQCSCHGYSPPGINDVTKSQILSSQERKLTGEDDWIEVV